MWRYLDGISPPPAKKKKAEAGEKQANYEKEKRQRAFLPSWQKNRPWLKFVPASQTSATTQTASAGGNMFCEICQSASKFDRSLAQTNFFVDAGCTSLRLESIKIHEVSSNHLKAKTIVAAKSEPEKTPAFKMISSLNKDTLGKLSKLFRTCHALAVHNRPYTDYTWLCELDETKGVNLGKTYRTAEYAKVFTHYIANVERNKVSDKIRNAQFVTVLSDGSTDSSITEQEMFFVRTCRGGEVLVAFAGIKQVEKGNAEAIHNSLKCAVTSSDYLAIPWNNFTSKLVGLGCDGAAVMLGRRNGLVALLKQAQPALVEVHCFAHRLELSFKDAVKKSSLYEKTVVVLLMGLYYFYRNSPLNRSMLKRSFATLGKKVYLPTRVGGTRWVGHLLRALTNFQNGYPSILQHLQQITDTEGSQNKTARAKAKCFLKLMMSKSVISFVHLLLDVCGPLKDMSVSFQQRDACVADIHRTLKSTVAVIQKYRTSDGKHLRMVTSDTTTYARLTGTDVEFNSARRKLTDGLVNALTERFSNASEGVIRASRVVKFCTWPTKTSELHAFGDDDIREVLDHYQQVLQTSGVDTALAEAEWTALKFTLYDEMKPDDIKCLTWEKVNRQYGRGHTNILSVIDLLLTLPASSAEVERGFSQLKLLKTDMRSKLKENHLNDLMSIKLLSVPITEFDPSEAIQLWNTSGILPRRPHFMETNKSSGKATGAIRAQAAKIYPRIDAAVPVVTDETTAELAGGDDGVTETVDPVSRVDSCEEDLELIDRAEDTVNNNTNAAGDMDTAYASDASDADSDIEERRVDSLINKY